LKPPPVASWPAPKDDQILVWSSDEPNPIHHTRGMKFATSVRIGRQELLS